MQIIIENMVTNYEDQGNGKTLLLLHGWGDNLNTFDSLIPFLSGFRVIRLDLPGFGKTDNPPKPWFVNDYVSFVNSFVSKLNIEVDCLLGHSFGGRIAIKGVALKKLNCNKLVLINSAGIAKGSGLIGGLSKMFRWLPQGFKKKFYRAIKSDYADREELKGTFSNIISEDLKDYAKMIDVPTLIIWGKDDTQTPLADGKTFNNLIPNSQLQIIDGGHFIHQEKPNEVASLIL